MIDLTINEEQLKRAVQRARERNIIIPTFRQQQDPGLIPEKITKQLEAVGLWDLDSHNLFRITWKNEPIDLGGGSVTLIIWKSHPKRKSFSKLWKKKLRYH